jgi:hypothetical protein
MTKRERERKRKRERTTLFSHFSPFCLLALFFPAASKTQFAAALSRGARYTPFVDPLSLQTPALFQIGSEMRLSATNARPTTAVAASRHCSATTTSPPSSSTTSLVHCRRRLPLSARAASLPVLPPLVTSMQRSCGRVPTKGAGRRIVSVSATPEAEASRPASASPAAARPPPPLVGALAVDKSLDDRISSGEFTDAGSTKERASRPVRKFLAKDPVGPGEQGDWLELTGNERERERGLMTMAIS